MNSTSGKIGAVGDADILHHFRSMGFMVREIASPEECANAVKELAGKGCVIIFVSDDLLSELTGVIAEYFSSPVPVITGFPGIEGRSLNSEMMLKAVVRRAIGIDIAGLTDI